MAVRVNSRPAPIYPQLRTPLLHTRWDVTPAFEDGMRELAELSKQKAPGVLSVRLRRSAGNDTKYLMLVITTDRAAARGWLLVPEIRAFTETNAVGQQIIAGSPSAEIYHVVKRYAGPALNVVQPAVAAVGAPSR